MSSRAALSARLGDPGERVQSLQADVAGGNVQRPSILLSEPLQRLFVGAIVDVVHQLEGSMLRWTCHANSYARTLRVPEWTLVPNGGYKLCNLLLDLTPYLVEHRPNAVC